jgi:hypothetical protein
MIAAIHQPNFLPWLGFFYKMSKAHCFVYLDNVQYVRGGFINRVKIKTQAGGRWLTVPVKKKGRYPQSISSVEVEAGSHWKRKVSGTLQACYCKAAYFKTYFPELEAIIDKEHLFLADLNIELTNWLASHFDIHTSTVNASELDDISGRSTERLASICNSIGADRYLSGFGGQKYQEEEIFKQYNIQLTVYAFEHPRYPQLWDDFTPGLSALDLLFNCGPQSAEIIRNI